MTTIVEVCNVALDLIGQGGRIKSLDEASPEAEACKLHFYPTYESCLDFGNWSFARRDEIIDEQDYLKDVCVLPYHYAYRLPKDVMRVLYLTNLDAKPKVETVNADRPIQFNFRNYDGEKVIATDHQPNFVIHYQAYVDPKDYIQPTFVSALSYMLASKLAASLIRGTDGITIGGKLYQLGYTELNRAAGFDAQQGAYSVDRYKPTSFIRARR